MVLKIGSKGGEVKRIQKFLGLENQDGIFGKATESAVKNWQIKNGLEPDGIVGERTLGLMFNEKKKDSSLKNSPINFSLLNGYIPIGVLQELEEIYLKFSINTPLRISHFLSQCSHESGGFRSVYENLNYSPSGLIRVFSKYFPGSLNESYAFRPEKIASRVYANRMGNGDEASKEGYRFRGRGYIQLTGKSNYIRFGNFIGEDLVSNPDLVATRYPLTSAAYFFQSNNIWSICDRGASDDVVEIVTKRVNGGKIGLEDRIRHFRKYYSILT